MTTPLTIVKTDRGGITAALFTDGSTWTWTSDAHDQLPPVVVTNQAAGADWLVTVVVAGREVRREEYARESMAHRAWNDLVKTWDAAMTAMLIMQNPGTEQVKRTVVKIENSWSRFLDLDNFVVASLTWQNS